MQGKWNLEKLINTLKVIQMIMGKTGFNPGLG